MSRKNRSSAGRRSPFKQVEPNSQELEKLANLYAQECYKDAESLSRQLIARFPDHGFAWKILGSVLQEQAKPEESLSVRKKTVELRPDDHEAHFNLACGLHQQGHLNEAADSYLASLGLQPNNAVAYNNLGATLKLLELLPDAEACCRQAIALQPNMASAHNNLGNVLHAQGKFTEARASFLVALDLKPDYAEAYNNLAIALKELGCWHDAKTAFRNALTIQPGWAAAHSNLLFCLSHDLQTAPALLYSEHLAFGEQFEAPFRSGWQAHDNTNEPERCLQVGFVSGDLYDHAIASFLEPVLEFLAPRHGLSLHAYYTHIREDAVTQRLRSHFPHWHAVANLSDAELANKIRADGIDILIDLSGHTAHNRLLTFARKPAPIQFSWLGYPGTTGLQAIDYYLCDQFWLPPGELAEQFIEKLAYLPVTAIFKPNEEAPPVNLLPALETGYITFGSFNRANKLNPAVIALWSLLLRNAPNSRMLLGGIPPDQQDGLIQNFALEGIELSRLAFHPRSNMRDYLSLHHQVDICLDTYPYTGGTTTNHAAWMGVPTLTLAGETPSSRSAATLMHFWDCDRLIATSIDDFVSKGLYWVTHIHELASIRTDMRSRFEVSHLGQADSFAANFEALLRTAWRRWCAHLPATSIEASATEYETPAPK